MKIIQTLKKGFRCFFENGFQYTWQKAIQKWKRHQLKNMLSGLSVLTDEMREEQLETSFAEPIKISILTPLYNTPIPFLKEMIASVQSQTYCYWELCLCDGSDEKHPEVENYCRLMAEKDSRIRYQRLKENRGISGNTNTCIALASGEYLGLLDHDDVLHPAALFEVIKVIGETGAEFVYTDEAKFSKTPEKCYDPNFKPDFSKDELRAHNYICHFVAYSRELLERCGGYREGYDGSQDHDIVLRMTEQTQKIVHIPQVLYFWRVHKDSVSSGVEVKSYAVDAAKAAVADQLSRCGETGEVSSIPPYPLLYRTQYKIYGEPKVSVLLYGRSSETDFVRCVRSMEDMSTYYPIELCILEPDLCPFQMKKACQTLPTVKPIVLVTTEEQHNAGNTFQCALERCSGEYIAFLHITTVLDTCDWVRELLMFAQRKDVGAVGAKLYDGRRSIYSGGIAVSQEDLRLLHHMFRGEPWGSDGYEAALRHVRNVTAVDGGCLMVSKEKLWQAGGIREDMGNYQFIDLCLRLRQAGLVNVWTPFASALFYGQEQYSPSETAHFSEVWSVKLSSRDPFYNPNAEKYRIY